MASAERARPGVGHLMLALLGSAWLAAPAVSGADEQPATAPAVADAPVAATTPLADASSTEGPLPDKPYGRPQAVRPHGQTLEYRVKLLTTELKLDAGQQLEVRKALEDQRVQIQALWNTAEMPAGQRVNATKVISDKTAERIRALLTEEQRKRYNIERKPRSPGDSAGKPDVEHWMEATRPK